MDSLDDLALFAAVVEHNGFSAAARTLNIEKTRLSRRVSALEKKLGVQLLQRSTRSMRLTEAGEKFFKKCKIVVDSTQAAYKSIQELKQEPSGSVRISCPIVLAQSYLAPILPMYMATHPKVTVFIEATDRTVNLVEERFDLALRARPDIEDSTGLVAKELGIAKRILVASPLLLNHMGYPTIPEDLSKFEIITRIMDMKDTEAKWELFSKDDEKEIYLAPRLISGDLRLQLEACIHGIGIALIPEPIVSTALKKGQLVHVLPEWYGAEHIIHLMYPKPQGLLPSVRSLIDYLIIHLPASILEQSI